MWGALSYGCVCCTRMLSWFQLQEKFYAVKTEWFLSLHSVSSKTSFHWQTWQFSKKRKKTNKQKPQELNMYLYSGLGDNLALLYTLSFTKQCVPEWISISSVICVLSTNSEKFLIKLSEAQCDSLWSLVLPHKLSKIQRYYTFYDRRQRKGANPHSIRGWSHNMFGHFGWKWQMIISHFIC